MKGLLVKDFRLLFQRKRSMIIILLCGAVMVSSTSTAFAAGWFMMIGAMFSVSTISYDEYDNCFPFLMTLPVSRRTYALEKYLFGILCGLAFWTVAVLMCLMIQLARGEAFLLSEEMVPLLIVFFAPVLIIDFTIPISLHFGTERSRTVLLIFWGAVVALAILAVRVFPETSEALSAVSGTAALTAAAVATAAVTALSAVISVKIMERKEF